VIIAALNHAVSVIARHRRRREPYWWPDLHFVTSLRPA